DPRPRTLDHVPIEFYCPHCETYLRTPDLKAGLSAECPTCWERIWVPHESEAPQAVPQAAGEIPREEETDFGDLSRQSPTASFPGRDAESFRQEPRHRNEELFDAPFLP